jgi:hypothetical protein
MRTHAAPSCNLRPNLDPLEDRHLLSGGFEAIGVNRPAAIVVAIEVRDQSQLVDLVGFPTGPSGFRGGAFPQMQPGWGGVAFASRNLLFAPGPKFLSRPEIQNQLVSLDSPSPPESRDLPAGVTTALTVAFSQTDSTSPDSQQPGPRPMPGPPPSAVFLSSDFLRFKLPELFLREHTFEAKPLPETNAGTVEGDMTESAQGGTAAITSGSQGVGAVTVGNTVAQVALPLTVAPVHLTALFRSDTGRSDSLIQAVRTNEAPGNPIIEAGRGSLSNTSSTHLAPADAPVAMAAAHPDDISAAPVPLTNDNRE